MYLHAGNNKNIKISDIVGIFDTDTATISKITKQYLSGCEKRGETVNISYELPKAFILTAEDAGSSQKKSAGISFLQLLLSCGGTI